MATVRHMRIAPGGWAACAHGHHQRKGIMAYIDMVHSFKRYQMGDTTIVANNDVSFGIEKGGLAIILGASGAGKSTVLNILGGMDTNSEGQVIIDGKDISDYNAHQLTEYRRHDIGFVFQFYNLVANLTAKENVELASELVKDAQDPVQALIDVGLKDRINNFPRSSPAASSSAWPSPAPWPRTRRSCCATSRPARWTTTPASRCCRSCRTRAARRARPW